LQRVLPNVPVLHECVAGDNTMVLLRNVITASMQAAPFPAHRSDHAALVRVSIASSGCMLYHMNNLGGDPQQWMNEASVTETKIWLT